MEILDNVERIRIPNWLGYVLLVVEIAVPGYLWWIAPLPLPHVRS